MIKFFRHFAMQVDYGEQECCREQPLLHAAEYQEYLYGEVPACPAGDSERSADAVLNR